MAYGKDALTDALGRLEGPGESSPSTTGLRPGINATRPAQSTVQIRLGLRQRLTAVTHDLDELWRDSLESGDFELVTGTVEANHAVHRAIVALEGGVDR